MSHRSCLGTLLILAGLVLVTAALGLLVLARTGHGHLRRGQAPAANIRRTPLPSSTPGPAPTIRLGPTAAAVATQLPPQTPVATAPLPQTRPGAPVRVIIPALGVDVPVVEVGWHVARAGDQVLGEWDTVAAAAGHHRGSADPGQPGNCVLSAHSSDAGGAVFRGLESLQIGDVVRIVTFDKNEYSYLLGTVLTLDQVGATWAEKREHALWLDPTAEAVLTLVTCWPPWSYTHRIVVRAELDQ